MLRLKGDRLTKDDEISDVSLFVYTAIENEKHSLTIPEDHRHKSVILHRHGPSPSVAISTITISSETDMIITNSSGPSRSA